LNSPSTNAFVGLSFHPDQISLVEIQDGQVQAIGARELVQPFDVETYYAHGYFFENQQEIIRELYQKVGVGAQETGVVLDEGMAVIKKIPVALGLEEGMLKETMEWEARQFLVSPMEEYIMEYQRLPFQTQLGNPVYVLILLRKNVLAGIHSLMKACGLVLKDVDISVFSSIRTLKANCDIETEETSVIIGLQRHYATFIFIRQNEYFLSCRVPFRDDGADGAVGEKPHLTDLLMKELRRLIFGHKLGRGVEDLNRIFLTGSENIQNISHDLSSTLSVPLEILNPFRKVNVASSVSQSAEYNNSPEKFVASMGIALKRCPIDQK
jgi:Tfp pilus assembly PilM family ATPase